MTEKVGQNFFGKDSDLGLLQIKATSLFVYTNELKLPVHANKTCIGSTSVPYLTLNLGVGWKRGGQCHTPVTLLSGYDTGTH